MSLEQEPVEDVLEMPVDPVRVYNDTRQRLDEAETRVKRMVAVISDADEKLKNWRKVAVVNTGVMAPAGTDSSAIDARSWPMARELAQALAEWHAAYDEARAAWLQVPTGDKTGLVSPPF